MAAVTVVGVSAVVVYTANAATETLLSRGKTATASSVEPAPNNSTTPSGHSAPGNAVDGNPGTRWSSESGNDPQWIAVDLGAPARITRVTLQWAAEYARAYRVEASTNGTVWTVLYRTDRGNGREDNLTRLADGIGQYLRIFGTGRGTNRGYSLNELQVVGRFTSHGGSAPPVEAQPPFSRPPSRQARPARIQAARIRAARIRAARIQTAQVRAIQHWTIQH